ncbi:unnamed protein product [Ectocarpus sp. CCAP 1310/34]|nr:unnamed protein product [Ectocarpus sp. CCAP 1310/34]
MFDQPVDVCAAWPASLRKLAFGLDFSKAIHAQPGPTGDLSWPASLRQLTFACYSDDQLPAVPGVEVCRAQPRVGRWPLYGG